MTMKRYIVLAIDRAWERCDDTIEFCGDYEDWLDAVKAYGEDGSAILDTDTGTIHDRFSPLVEKAISDFAWYMLDEILPFPDRLRCQWIDWEYRAKALGDPRPVENPFAFNQPNRKHTP